MTGRTLDQRDGQALEGRKFRCRACGELVVFARTLPAPPKRGGRPMPLDPWTNAAGNVAVRNVGGGTLVCRVLKRDEGHDVCAELRAMPHFATCVPKLPDPPPAPPANVVSIDAARARRDDQARARRSAQPRRSP